MTSLLEGVRDDALAAVPAGGGALPGVPGVQSRADRALGTAAEAGHLSATRGVLEETCAPWGAPYHSGGAHRVVASDVTQQPRPIGWESICVTRR